MDFIQVAKYLERGRQYHRLIDVKYHILAPNTSNKADVLSCSVDIIQWMAVLKSCSALEAFKKVHLSRIQPENILEFLILDKTFSAQHSFFHRCSKRVPMEAVGQLNPKKSLRFRPAGRKNGGRAELHHR